MDIKVLAIRTDFIHHGENSGYKQILKYIKPFKILGVNERDPETRVSLFKRKYLWLFEFDAWRYRKETDLIHILYGEDYYRWSARLFKNIPIVATFHQPAEILRGEVLKGDYRGRIGKVTHTFNKNRFKELSAAIVTSKSQIEVLQLVMPVEKIHYIPLGVHLNEPNKVFQNYLKTPIGAQEKINIITVGNWLRDWEFYFEVVDRCQHWNFYLVNKNFERKYLERAKTCKNVFFRENISDSELYELYVKSDCQFLPVKGIAGSNAFLEGLALGCPIVITDVNAENEDQQEFISLFAKGDVDDCIRKITQVAGHSPEFSRSVRKKANLYANQFSWEKVALKTIELYKKLI